MSDEENVSMLLHLFVQIFDAGEFGERDFGGGLFLGECLSEVVVSCVEAVGGEEVGYGD